MRVVSLRVESLWTKARGDGSARRELEEGLEEKVERAGKGEGETLIGAGWTVMVSRELRRKRCG